jgi:hypothetical protein
LQYGDSSVVGRSMAGGDRGPKVRLSHKSDASHKIQVTRGTVASEKDDQMSETMIKNRNLSPI